MADLEEKNKNLSQNSATAIADARVAQAEKAEEKQGEAKKSSSKTLLKPFVSKGWRVHNTLTYFGVDWILNSMVGVATTYFTQRTKLGNTVFTKPVSGFFKAILSPVLKGDARNEGAKWGTMFASIMVGGFSIIPVIMGLENKERKKRMVKWFDEKIYGKEVVANDPKFAESYKRIDEEPEKKFSDGIWSRLIAIAPLISAASWPTTNKPLIKYLYDPIGDATKKVAKGIGIKPKSAYWMDPKLGALEHIEGDPKIAKQWQSNWDFFHRTIGFDFGLTVFYAIFHEIAYKTLAAMGMKKEKKKASPASPESSENISSIASSSNPEEIPEAKKWSQRNENKPGRGKSDVPAASFAEAAVQSSGKEASVSV